MRETKLPSEPSAANFKPYPQTASDKKLTELGYDMLDEQRRAVKLAGLIAGEPVLDVATGSGRMMLALVEAGYQVISGDISEEVVRETRERLGDLVQGAVDFRVLDAMRLDLADASLASVVTANAMHHMAEPRLVLGEMTRVLKPNGKLLLAEFNDNGFDVIDQVHRAVHGQPHERGLITSREICDFLHERFERVEHHVLALNNVWVASGKRARPAEPDGHGFHAHCFACGALNDAGIGLRFTADGPNAVVAHPTIGEKFQGYDQVVQGGIVCLLLDSAMANCLFMRSIQAMTARLNVRFSKPVAIGLPLTVKGCLVKEKSPGWLGKTIYTLRASVEQDSKIRASATGTFVRVN